MNIIPGGSHITLENLTPRLLVVEQLLRGSVPQPVPQPAPPLQGRQFVHYAPGERPYYPPGTDIGRSNYFYRQGGKRRKTKKDKKKR